MRNRLLSIVLVSLSALSCATIELPDTEFCADFGPEGAACFFVFSEGERVLDQAAWDAERMGMICTSSDSFAQWKASVEKLCYEAKCTAKQKRDLIRALTAADDRVQEIRRTYATGQSL